jgi:hypothetical protein
MISPQLNCILNDKVHWTEFNNHDNEGKYGVYTTKENKIHIFVKIPSILDWTKGLQPCQK